jgi:uncharacterized protein YegL
MNNTPKESISFEPSKFSIAEAKGLPVYLILDVSGSMNEVIDDDFERTGEFYEDDGKTWERVMGGTSRLKILSDAVKTMLAAFVEEEKAGMRILVTILTFGAEVKVLYKSTNASDIEWDELKDGGGETLLGKALAFTKEIIEDKKHTPSHVYRPTVVLVSDGKPTDEGWGVSLEQFIQKGRSSKCDRMAMAIGPDADSQVLGKFIEDSPHPLFQADDAAQLNEFFQLVTMSITIRGRSINPNLIPKQPKTESVSSTEEDSIEKLSTSQSSEESEEIEYW